MVKTILSVKNLSIEYNQGTVVNNVTFELKKGEILAIVGPSGCGKSTILKAIAGLLGKAGTVTQGEVIFEGRNITELSGEERRRLAGKKIAMIFQDSAASFCPIRTIGDQIYESVKEHEAWSRAEFVKRAEDIMDSINLDRAALNEYPFKLSGGMAQRAGILAAMILQPTLLLADEPTSALDVDTQAMVARELLNICKQYQTSMVIVTHDLKLAEGVADKFFVMGGADFEDFAGKALG